MKTPFTYSKWHNFLGYEALWFTAVLGTDKYQWALGLLLALHIGFCQHKRADVFVMLTCGFMGTLVDSFLAVNGFYQFASPPEWLPIPLWQIAIWLGFAGSLRHSLSYMASHPLMMTLAAGVFAPLSYLAAARLGAVEFPQGNMYTLTIVSMCWMSMLPIFIFLTGIAKGLEAKPHLKVFALPSTVNDKELL